MSKKVFYTLVVIMWGQTFSAGDIPSILTLGFLELLLSSDNAIVIGLLANALPPSSRRKALYIGILSAFFLRAITVILSSWLLQYIWIQLLGATYLFFLSLRYWFQKPNKSKQKDSTIPSHIHSFWKAIIMIELFDLAFAIDSIAAAMAFIGPFPKSSMIHPKLWVVYLGGMIGLIATRYTSEWFSYIMDTFPRLKTSAYFIVGWIGLELTISALELEIPHFSIIFWTVNATLFLFGFTQRVATKK